MEHTEEVSVPTELSLGLRVRVCAKGILHILSQVSESNYKASVC